MNFSNTLSPKYSKQSNLLSDPNECLEQSPILFYKCLKLTSILNVMWNKTRKDLPKTYFKFSKSFAVTAFPVLFLISSRMAMGLPRPSTIVSTSSFSASVSLLLIGTFLIKVSVQGCSVCSPWNWVTLIDWGLPLSAHKRNLERHCSFLDLQRGTIFLLTDLLQVAHS